VNSATILVVDDDAAVRQVLSRVLTRDGHMVLEAGDAARALALAEGHQLDLAILDLCLTDGDATSLAERLHARWSGLPLILITGYPLRLHESPELSRPFLRVLTKPVDIHELRLAVNNALIEGAMQTPSPTPQPDPTPVTSLPIGPEPEQAHTTSASHTAVAEVPVHGKREALRSTIVVVMALAVLVGFVAYVTGLIPGMSAAQEPVAQQDAPPNIKLVADKPHTLSVPPDVRAALGIRKGGEDQTATVEVPTQTRPLVLSGSTGLDPSQLFRIRVRFTPAEVMKIGEAQERIKDTDYGLSREWRTGDVFHKGQLLGSFYSIDVGNKKNDLVDALAQLRLDLDILDASQAAYNRASLSLLDLLAAERAVRGDFNAIERAENTLRAWGIPEADVESVRQEAAEIIKKREQEKKTGIKPNRDPKQLEEQLKRWAQVEIRVPAEFDGATIVERNLNVRDVVVDNTLNLFQIARVDPIMVYVNAPEEDLPRLQKLNDAQRHWTIRTVGEEDGIDGRIEDIGYIIDPAQHSAVVKGHIPNEGGRLRGGQYVTATVKLPPPDDVVAIPPNALADDGRQAGVFVEIADGVYTFRRVEVVQRFDHSIFVRSRFPNGQDVQALTPEEQAQGLLPRQALKPGEKVITAGVLELKKELEDREASAAGQ
jgi:cobalt-zinc-cadmium efflux system membrane fusion protein